MKLANYLKACTWYKISSYYIILYYIILYYIILYYIILYYIILCFIILYYIMIYYIILYYIMIYYIILWYIILYYIILYYIILYHIINSSNKFGNSSFIDHIFVIITLLIYTVGHKDGIFFLHNFMGYFLLWEIIRMSRVFITTMLSQPVSS